MSLTRVLAVVIFLLPAFCAADDSETTVNNQQPTYVAVGSSNGQIQTTVAAAIQPEAVHELDSFAGVNDTSQSLTPESGFWFLNTHQSPQTFSTSGPVFRPQVSRYEKGSGYRSSDYSEMLSRLEPGVPVCIMAHGSFVDTLSATRESCYTYHWIRSAAGGQRMQMIYFHWPSYRAISPLIQLDTNQLGRQAARNGFYLADLISALPPECPVAILGHSHGSRVASSALHLLAGGVVQGYRHRSAGTNRRPIRTVFLAGAIDHHWLNPGERYDRALYSTQGILNLKNRSDPALAIYPLRLPLFTRRPIGNLGMTNADRRRIGPQSQKLVNFEVSAVIGHSHLWPYYFNSQRIAMTMRNYVYFPDLLLPTAATHHASSTEHAVARPTLSNPTASQTVSSSLISQANTTTIRR
ncbi:MAG: hypothetical protein ABJZ55_21195 [Fuerstiella sp.]